MKARPGSLDDMWLDGEANIPVEEELVQLNVLTTPIQELISVMGRAAGEIRALRLHVKNQDRHIDGLRSELKALEEL